MADKPSRGLVLYGDGLARFVDSSHANLHSLSSLATCGFLSLPNAPPSESEDERVVREFACLLDAAEAYIGGGVNAAEMAKQCPTLSERFMGMKAALVTDNSGLKSFGNQLGLNVLQLGDLCQSSESLKVDGLASELLKLLGFQEGKVLELNQFDLVFLHIGAGERVSGNEDKGNDGIDVGLINSLVGSIMHLAQPGSEIASRLHLSLVMSYGSVSGADDPDFSVKVQKEKMDPKFFELFPHQSYTMKGEQPRDDVRHHCPMLIAQWQYAVTRKDQANTFSFKSFKEFAGNLVIPADRFLHEVAFKLWKAPKYGA